MIAYYAHSHGNGHFNSAKLFADTIYEHTLILKAKEPNTLSNYHIVPIEDEDTSVEEYKSAIANLPDYAHYLPKSNKKILKRAKQIIDSIIAYNITLVCVDVSVETATLCRLCSIPYGYYLLPGDREDEPHKIAYRAAEFLYTFLPRQMLDQHVYAPFVSKTFFLGFFSRFAYCSQYRIVENTPKLDGKKVLIICGNGGTNFTAEMIIQIQEKLAICNIKVVGNINGDSELLGNDYLGYVTNVDTYIKESDVVISSCGINLTAEILSLKNKFIAYPENRPYKEQEKMAQALIKNKLAVLFDLETIDKCVKNYLQLIPPKDLKQWFYKPEDIINFKNKIKSYET
ncbi:glycosyltransferase [Aquimarina sp. W85]|uniref:glycosyltransferase n=1 Tax=Aquimarina rhodophyticola TaxID=3342246 RepID=UPI00366D77CF